MRRFFFTASALVAAIALTGCGPEQRAQWQLNAASSDLDPDVFSDADGYASTTGDGPFPDPFVSGFEVTLADGADLVEAGAQLNMLVEDHEMSADVLIEEGKELWTERHWRDASELTDEEWAEVLELVIEEDMTRASLQGSRDTEDTFLSFHYESDDYQEAVGGFLSWQELEQPEGVHAMRGSLEFPERGGDREIRMESPHIELSSPLGEGDALAEVVDAALDYPGWHEVRRLDLHTDAGDGARFEMELFLDDEPRGSDNYLKFLAENPESYGAAEDFADYVEETLDLQGKMDTRIYVASSVSLVSRGSFADDRTPEETNSDKLESIRND